MSMLMLCAWQINGTQYKTAFQTSAQAYYQGSELKQAADIATSEVRRAAPSVALIAPVAYTAAVSRRIQLKSKKFSPLPGAETSYRLNQNDHSGSIAFTWEL